MGSRFRKALVAESVRDSLHSWCKRVKDRSRHSLTARSTCSLESIIDDETITVASGTLSRCSSAGSLNQLTVNSTEHPEAGFDDSDPPLHDYSFDVSEYSSKSFHNGLPQPTANGAEDIVVNEEENRAETLFQLFQKT